MLLCSLLAACPPSCLLILLPGPALLACSLPVVPCSHEAKEMRQLMCSSDELQQKPQQQQPQQQEHQRPKQQPQQRNQQQQPQQLSQRGSGAAPEDLWAEQ